jgi:putative transposase
MIQQAEHLAQEVGVSRSCQVLEVPRSSLYRARVPLPPAPVSPPVAHHRPPPPSALTPQERTQVREILNSPRFQDQAPRQVWAQLLDEGHYLCSWRTMYRLLAVEHQVRERRHQLRHPTHTKPELLATAPNQLWSWDITKLRGPTVGTYFYLYVVLDVFSRYVVGWMVAQQESADLAMMLIETTCQRQGIQPAQLTLHADRGGPMTAKSMVQLLDDLGVTKTHSRPHVSNDNPYSEAQFKTLKYRPDFPDRFGALADVRTWAHAFFHWYNQQHFHSGLELLTPATVHYRQDQRVQAKRQQVLQTAYATHPERFVRGRPTVQKLPTAVWINKPNQTDLPALDTSLNDTPELSQSP